MSLQKITLSNPYNKQYEVEAFQVSVYQLKNVDKILIKGIQNDLNEALASGNIEKYTQIQMDYIKSAFKLIKDYTNLLDVVSKDNKNKSKDKIIESLTLDVNLNNTIVFIITGADNSVLETEQISNKESQKKS